jgi:hypothetical protein
MAAAELSNQLPQNAAKRIGDALLDRGFGGKNWQRTISVSPPSAFIVDEFIPSFKITVAESQRKLRRELPTLSELCPVGLWSFFPVADGLGRA